jgi:hypothetical protein
MRNFPDSKTSRITCCSSFAEQATRPLTIGLAIQDSPMGILAWIGEKYREWSDPDVFPTPEFRQDILATASLYFLSSTFATFAITYKEDALHITQPLPPITKPFGLSEFKHDAVVLPRRWIEKGNNVHYYNAHDRGGLRGTGQSRRSRPRP